MMLGKNKDQVNQNSDQNLKDAINQVIADLDSGKSRVAEKINGEWVTHQHLKKAIMLSFRIYPMENLNGPYSSWYDKSHLLKGKTAGWTKVDHEKAGFRMVPNSPVRKGTFVGKNAVLMPCYVNIGAYIDEGTMIDTFARAGSCCQIGKNCHISFRNKDRFSILCEIKSLSASIFPKCSSLINQTVVQPRS